MSHGPRLPDGSRIERFAVVPSDPELWVSNVLAPNLPSNVRVHRVELHPLSVVGGMKLARTKLREAQRDFPRYAQQAGFRLVRTTAFRTRDIRWTPAELAALPSVEPS